MERAQRQRSNVNQLERECTGGRELERVRVCALLEPSRQEQQHRLGPQPSHGEREHRGRRGVEPLHVVDRQRHRRIGGQRAQEPEKPERHRALVR